MFYLDMRSATLVSLLCFIAGTAAAPRSEANHPVSHENPRGEPGKPNNGGHLHESGTNPPGGEPQLAKICFCCPPDKPRPTWWCDLLTESGTCPNFDSAFTDKVCCTFNFNDGTSNCADLGPSAANAVAADSAVNSILSSVGTVVDGLLRGIQ